MKVMSRAFSRRAEGFFYSLHSTEKMLLEWLRALVIPSNAKILWFELLDTPTKHSIPVEVEIYDVFVEVSSGPGWGMYSCFYFSEIAEGGLQKLKKHIRNCPKSKKIHMQVYYRTS